MRKLSVVIAPLALCLVWASPGRADVQPEANELPTQQITLDSLARERPPEAQWWHVYAAPGAEYDTNINHLLINSSADSNNRVSDVIILTSGGLSLKPSPISWLSPSFSYNFDRYDYLQHSEFSFYSHQVFGSLHERLSRSWSFEQGLVADWYGDSTGLLTDGYNLFGGLRWKHWGFHGRFGYSYRRDGYIYSQDKDSHSNMAYTELSRYFRWSFLFLGYYYRRNHANNEVFSYHSHFVTAGWTANWTPKLRTTFLAGYYDKPYEGFDLRFNTTRHDRTYSAGIKPSYAFFPQLRLIGSFLYSYNDSTAEVKRYYDQIYGLTLEARF